MPGLFKRVVLSFLAFLILFMSVAPSFSSVQAADSTWYNQGGTELYLKVFDDHASPSNEIFGERYTVAQVQWIFWSIPFFFLNRLVFGHTEVLVCLFSHDIAGCFPEITDAFKLIRGAFLLSSRDGPNVGGLANIVRESSISGIAYTKDLLSKFNPVTRVGAQGFGYTTAANSVQKLWRISRNFSFGLLVIAVIIISFLIMFRAKINPQTVISIQSSLPKIISAVILITFSYAIAGFIIDLMYVVIALLASLIHSGELSAHTTSELFDSFTTGESAIGLIFEFWFAFMVTSFVSIFSSWAPTVWAGGIVLLLFSVLFIFVAILYTFKILVLTFKTFVQIIMTIVTGPFEILLGTVAQNAGFGPWLRKLISQVAVYPTMALLFFLAFFFLAQAWNVGLLKTLMGDTDFIAQFPFNPVFHVIEGNVWDPPLTTGVVEGGALLWTIVGFVIITLVPKTAEIVQGFISGKGFEYDFDMGMGGVTEAARKAGDSAGIYVENVKAGRMKAKSFNILGKTITTEDIANRVKYLSLLPKK